MRTYRLSEFAAHEGAVNCVRIGRHTAGVLATGGDDKKVNLWRTGQPEVVRSLCGLQSPVMSVVFDEKEDTIAAGGANGTIKIWEMETGKVSRSLTGHRAGTVSLTFTTGEPNYLVSGSEDCNVKVWDLRRKEAITTFQKHKEPVVRVAVSPDSKWVCSGSKDGEIKLWDLDSGRVIRDTWRHGAAVTGLEFNQVEFLMVSSGADRTVRVWDLELFEEMECMGPEATAVQGIAYAKDGSVLLSATADALKVWGLDPARHHDTVPIEWRNLADLHLYYKDNQPRALGCCRSGSTVGVFMVDLRKVAPFCRDPSQAVGIGAGGTQHASSSSSVRSTAGNAAQEYQGTRQLALPQQQPSLRSDLGSDSDKGSVPGYMSLLCEAAVASAAPEPIEAGPLTRQLPRTHTPPRAAAPAGITHSSSANSRQAGPPIVQPSQQPSPARRAAQAQPVPVQLSPRQHNARQQQHSHGRQQQQQDLSKGSNYFPEVEIRVPSGRTPPPAAVEQPMLSMQPPSRGQQRGHSAARPGPAAANGRMQQELAPDSVTQLASGLAAASLLDPQRQQPQHEARSSSSTRPKEGSGAGGVLSATLAAWLDELPEASAPDHASSAAHSKASSRSSSMPASRVPSRHNMGGILQPQQQLVAAGGASAAAAPADPILAAMAGRVGLKVELARMVAALQVAKGFASRGNLEGAYKSVLHQGDPALACMVLEAVSQRADAFELNSLEPLIKLLELLLGSGHDQQVRTGLSALGLVLRGPGQTVHDVCSAPQPTGVDLSFEARHSKCMILKMALEGLGLKVGVLSRSQGATGTQAQMLAEELKRVVSVA